MNSQSVREYIEKNYYQDLNKQHDWNDLIYTSLKNGEDLIDNIERYAENGITNLKRLVVFNSTNFVLAYESLLPVSLHSQKQLLQWYAELLCYFYNCYDKSKKKSLLDLPLEDKLAFIYSSETNEVFELIKKEQTLELNTIKKLLLDNVDYPIKKSNLFLRDIIALNYILHDGDLFNKNKSQDIVLEKKIILSTVTSKLKQDSAFSWLMNEIDETFFSAMLTTIEIFNIFKNMHVLCGSKKNYGYIQKLLDKVSGKLLYSITYQDHMYLIKADSSMLIGQANISSIEILSGKNILINFKNGAFFDNVTSNHVAFSVALAINHFFVIKSMYLLLESTFDNPDFTKQIQEQLRYFNPENDKFIHILPSLKLASVQERTRYLMNADDIISTEIKNQVIEHIKFISNDPAFYLSEPAFLYVKLIELQPDDVLVKEGDSSEFVYLPFNEGLEGSNKQENIIFYPKAWMPVGHVGVIQHDVRTATIVAKQKVKLLMIPGEIYLNYWHVVLTVDELRKKIITL